MPSNTEPTVDGRHARRARGRLAVLDAMIDLARVNGDATPEEVAERAGVSIASLFRYFDTLEGLRFAATRRYFERYAHIFDIDDIGVGSIEQRVDNLITSRLRLYDDSQAICRLLRQPSTSSPTHDETLQQIRNTLRDQVSNHFDEELRTMTPAKREDTTTAISVLTSFESWDQFITAFGRTPQQTRRAWKTATLRLLPAE